MGVMQKLMRCSKRDFKMNSTQSGSVAEPTTLVAGEKEFTAEHILQLCKFLAEKSKRNKSLYKQRRQQKREAATYENSSFEFEEISPETEPIPLLTERLCENSSTITGAEKSSHILTAKVTTSTTDAAANAVDSGSSASRTSTAAASTCALQYATQEKRDILLKIRHQIFERKRQRQLAQLLQQRCGVWRPW